jgi:hypothetical protein
VLFSDVYQRLTAAMVKDDRLAGDLLRLLEVLLSLLFLGSANVTKARTGASLVRLTLQTCDDLFRWFSYLRFMRT